MKLQLSVFGDEQIERELLRFSAYAGHPQLAFLKIAEDMREQIGEQFDSQGQRGSGGWEPLAESTLAAKAAAGLPADILQATRQLFHSLTEPGGDHIEEVTDEELVFGSRDPKGRFHQTGTTRMPARRPVDFTELDRRSYVRTLQGYIMSGEL